jgi:hypothetical protein
MPLTLRLPGAGPAWTLPDDWSDAGLRFAWNVAREEGKELRIELQRGGEITYLVMYPSIVPWYELTAS